MKCHIYDTECLNADYCSERDACCAGDPEMPVVSTTEEPSDVAEELADALRYRDVVLKALPIDEEADRAAAAALRRRHAGQPTRKLVRK